MHLVFAPEPCLKYYGQGSGGIEGEMTSPVFGWICHGARDNKRAYRKRRRQPEAKGLEIAGHLESFLSSIDQELLSNLAHAEGCPALGRSRAQRLESISAARVGKLSKFS